MINKELFLVEPTEMHRNKTISNMLNGIDLKGMKIMPAFKKKQYLFKFLSRDIVVNDFYISDYDTFILDRKLAPKVSVKAIKHFIADYINYKFCDYILADTKTHFDYWQDIYGETSADLFVLPVLSNIEIFKPSAEIYNINKELRVFFFGSFIPLHGLEKIIYAIAKLKDTDIKFVLSGKGQESQKIKELIKQLDLVERIELSEKTLGDKMVHEIYKSDIVLGIFGDSKKARSVIPNKVYEALACKKCVLTMDSPAMREFFNEEEVCLVPSDPEAISKTILSLNDNRSLMEKYAENGYKAFMDLYEKTQRDFIQFIKNADT